MLVIQGAKFVNNKATIGNKIRGGAICLVGPEISSDPTVTCVVQKNATFVNNTAGYGGAISAVEARLFIDDTLFLENTAGHGGAVWAQVVCYVHICAFLILWFYGF